MGDMREVEMLYREIGRHFKDFDPWHIYVITSCDYFEKLYGRRADKTRKLYNGMLPCTLYQFFKPFEPRNDKFISGKSRTGNFKDDKNFKSYPKGSFNNKNTNKKG